MAHTYPLHRIEEFGLLSEHELDALSKVRRRPYKVERGHSICREGDPVLGFFLLLEGWVIASEVIPSGARQVLKVHLPGDVLGAHSLSSDHALATLTALTPAVVSSVTLADFGALAEQHPRIAMRLFLSAQRERAALMDQLTSMGRTSAESRMAALLLDLAERLSPLQLVRDDAYDLLLTQEQLGDLLGLTSVHVNRTLRHLEKSHLIARKGRRLTILARQQLSSLAERPPRPPRKQLDWMPAAR